MNIQALLQGREQRGIRVGLVGAGEFGATFIAQARRIPGLGVPAICDRDGDRAVAAARSAGFGADDLRRCDSVRAAEAAIEAGLIAVVEDAGMLVALPLDLVVEATGSPEAAASTALAALEAGRHVAMVTKEAEIVVGPLLAARARAAGLVHTPVDGDQPSLLIGLVAWAQTLGLPVVAAGKASESDVVLHGDEVEAWGRRWPAPGYTDRYELDEPLERSLAGRVVPGLAVRTPPDLCEMGIVANHTGLGVDHPELHAPIARPLELPLLFRPREDGGLLGTTGIVDMFNCLRRRDEASFAGGVFVVVETPDAETGRLLASKGLPASPDHRYLMLANPVHLLGVEAPMSVLSACRLGVGTGGTEVRQRQDLVGRASRDLDPGEELTLGERHVVAGLEPLLQPAAALADDAALPYYLAAGRRVRRKVAAGALLRVADVDLDEGAALLRLRREQDRLPAG
jgi:predicted homoserine dehydrogenase-like protein